MQHIQISLNPRSQARELLSLLNHSSHATCPLPQNIPRRPHSTMCQCHSSTPSPSIFTSRISISSLHLSLIFSLSLELLRSNSLLFCRLRENRESNEARMLDTWQTITSFLTPATLFLLMNLVIATILLSSRRHHGSHEPDPSGTSFTGAYHFPLLRTNSPVLQRLRSFTLHRFRSGDFPIDPLSSPGTPTTNLNPIPAESEPNPTIGNGVDDGEVINTPAPSPSPPPLARTSSILDRIKSINLYRFRSGEIQTEEVKTETAAAATTEHHYGRSHSESRPVAKKKKMKKVASVGGEGIDEMEMRQRRSIRARDVVVEEEVDARADDFINRFKEQLKIQRLNSILNYKEMLNRGW